VLINANFLMVLRTALLLVTENSACCEVLATIDISISNDFESHNTKMQKTKHQTPVKELIRISGLKPARNITCKQMCRHNRTFSFIRYRIHLSIWGQG